MAVETWDQLPKNQTDPETIEQAINRLISAHNDEPTSHALDNQAIAVHRQNEILDHKAGSVLADKWTMSEMEFTTCFENINVFGKHGTVNQAFPGVTIEPTASGDANYSSVSISLEDHGLSLDLSKDVLFQVPFLYDTYGGGTAILKMSWGIDPLLVKGMGLELSPTNKRFFISNEAGTSINYLNWPTYEDVTAYIIRVQNSPSEGKIYVYINGELLGTMDCPDSTAMDVGYLSFASKKSGSSQNWLQLYSLYFSIQP